MYLTGTSTIRKQLNACVSVLPQRERELELLVASTNLICACLLTPVGGGRVVCLPVCARMCVCSAVNFGHTCLKCVNFSSSCVAQSSR